MECWRRRWWTAAWIEARGLLAGRGVIGATPARCGWASGCPPVRKKARRRTGVARESEIGGGVARARRRGAARGSSLRGAASGLLRRGGRASGCPPVRKAASGVAGKAKSAAAWRARGVRGGWGLLGEGRSVGATPARWASLGVPSGEEGGVGGGQGGESAAAELWGRAEDEDDR